MAKIIAREDGATIPVSNGDSVTLDLPEDGSVTIEQGRGNTRNFRIDYGDEDGTSNRVIVDTDSFTRDGLQIQIVGYDPSDIFVLEGAENIQIGVPRLNEITFEYGDGFVGTVKILDPQERDLTDEPPPLVICFADGTIIETELGPRRVESLLVGDRVKTVDHGFCEVRWIGRRSLDAETLAQNPHLRPVRIKAGALGNDLPWTDLVVSPQHRICINDWRAELYYGHNEVLVPAKSFVDWDGVDILEDWTGTYFHLLLDRHEMLWSNGLVTESLHPGEIALSALGEQDQTAILKHVRGQTDRFETCRPVIRVQEARGLTTLVA